MVGSDVGFACCVPCFKKDRPGGGEGAGDVSEAVRTDGGEGGLTEDEEGRVGRRGSEGRADDEVGVSELRSLVVINLKCCEVVGANPELYGRSDIVNVCGDVENNVCERGTVEAENLNADGLSTMGGGGSCSDEGLKRT